MTTRRLGVAVAVLGGFLYAIGGSDGQTPLNTVERFDPRSNKWTVVAPMSTRRKHLGCAGELKLLRLVGTDSEAWHPATGLCQAAGLIPERTLNVLDVENFQSLMEFSFLF